jgi:succinate-semialdehyde dehydrogenase/glutarate-semialdehyde dehydrogenase
MNNMVKVVLPLRFIAVEAIADEFIQKFKDALSKLSRGSDGSLLGPLSSEEAAEHLADQVNRSVKGVQSTTRR